ncbi:protein adenylyltransferase SelO [Virgibacillus sp. YIM 98842]|uniref:protein adenylyltransferase SelO n=1 Tax=Virgibacillus sp. YIM 98842 TaxID=2663533 RepID=UPI001F08B2C5|nr:YdiU family protein [Virgibacillus sp. YIM 98842]
MVTQMINQAAWDLEDTYSELPELFYTKQQPAQAKDPELVIFNQPLAKSIGLQTEKLSGEALANVFSGNQLPDEADPLAQAYAGHQFGHFTMLGDGRAVLIGEKLSPSGERFDIQLKGAGRTPYSRGGDGRAALGPMLREYIISEAMHGLGIPTSRSLAVTTTGEKVRRETFLTGAIVTRIASSHIRVGTFEYAARWGSLEDLKALADYTINRHFPEIKEHENPYLSLYEKVIDRQASLIAGWQLIGFIHGVMNTDNMTVSGETIDYGPCAFMNQYDPKTVFSSIDVNGRYAYENQPGIGEWNLARFAEALLPLFQEDSEKAVATAQHALGNYAKLYWGYWLSGMRKKLGLAIEKEEDESLVKELLQLMENHEADFTNTFRLLTLNDQDNSELFTSRGFREWKKKWKERQTAELNTKKEMEALMKENNPFIIPRNHLVEEALEAAVEKQDYSVMNQLLDILSRPYDYNQIQEKYFLPPNPSDEPFVTYCGT